MSLLLTVSAISHACLSRPSASSCKTKTAVERGDAGHGGTRARRTSKHRPASGLGGASPASAGLRQGERQKHDLKGREFHVVNEIFGNGRSTVKNRRTAEKSKADRSPFAAMCSCDCRTTCASWPVDCKQQEHSKTKSQNNSQFRFKRSPISRASSDSQVQMKQQGLTKAV
jgi:hypothetical protein